jgi:hypothetical protein
MVRTVAISGDKVLSANHTDAYLTHPYVVCGSEREELAKLEADWAFAHGPIL